MEKLINLINDLLIHSDIKGDEARLDFVEAFFQSMCDCILDQIYTMKQYEDILPMIDTKMKEEDLTYEGKVAFIDSVIGSINEDDIPLIIGRSFRVTILRSLLNLIDTHSITHEGMKAFLRNYQSDEMYYAPKAD